MPGALAEARQRLWSWRFGKFDRWKAGGAEKRVHERAIFGAQTEHFPFQQADVAATQQPFKKVFHGEHVSDDVLSNVMGDTSPTICATLTMRGNMPIRRKRQKISTTVAPENGAFLKSLIRRGKASNMAEAVDRALATARRAENRARLEAATEAYFASLSPEEREEDRRLSEALDYEAGLVNFDE